VLGRKKKISRNKEGGKRGACECKGLKKTHALLAKREGTAEGRGAEAGRPRKAGVSEGMSSTENTDGKRKEMGDKWSIIQNRKLEMFQTNETAHLGFSFRGGRGKYWKEGKRENGGAFMRASRTGKNCNLLTFQGLKQGFLEKGKGR